jgi:hypothetical protein
VRAEFGDALVFEQDDQVGVLDGRQAVRADEVRLPAPDAAQVR